MSFFIDTDGNNAILTVVRRGVLGDVLVFWTAGLPGSVVDNGSIVPTGDNFRMGPNNSTAQFSLRVSGIKHNFFCQITCQFSLK